MVDTNLLKIRSREGFIDRCNLIVAQIQIVQLAVDEGVEGINLQSIRPFAQMYLRQISELFRLFCSTVENGHFNKQTNARILDEDSGR